MKPYLWGILILLSLSGCARLNFDPVYLPSREAQKPAPMPVDTGRHIGPFTQVIVKGPLDVTLHTDSKKPKVILYGDKRDTAEVYWDVKDGILLVELGPGYPKYGPVRVDISSRYLTSFSYHGKGNIMGKNLHSKALNLMIDNDGKTLLQGQLNICKLVVKGTGTLQINGVNSRTLNVKLSGKPHVQLVGVTDVTALDLRGNAWMSLYWVRSKNLTIRARGAAFVQLAGITDILDVELWDSAHFSGRYLRGRRSFVKTHGHSEADISAVRRQHTLATDSSNIYYYNLPEMKADFMALNGSVLDLREWEQPFLQEPTRYNH